MDLLTELNEAQREAVTTTEGFVRVIAGAGSGKTKALTYRFAYLVNELGILPGHILCVTFTNKAAQEMRTRIHTLTGDNDTGYINTFHGFCVSVLQEDINVASYPKSFLVLDNSDIDQMLQTIYDERGLTLSDMTFSRARDMIEIKKLIELPEYYMDLVTMDEGVLKERYLAARDTKDIIFYGYLYQQKKCFGLDYNDLLKFTLYIFRADAEVRAKWQSRLEYIMIDEFQDIDDIQYELMQVLCAYHKNLFIVGDPDQTIYTWRGANVKYILNFDLDYPTTRTIMMNRNYRSTPEILAVCNSLISKNKDRIAKDLTPVKAPGPRPLCHYADSSDAESLWIADKILELEASGTKLSDIAILYRAHYMTRTLEDALLKKKIPYTIYSGVQFYDRIEIKDALSYLRMIAIQDDLSFARIVNKPRRNIGKRRMEILRNHAESNGASLYDTLKLLADDPLFKGTGAQAFIDMIERLRGFASSVSVSDLLSMVMDMSGYEKQLRTEGAQDRLDDLAELRQSIRDFEVSCGEECTLPYYLAHVALFTGTDTVGMEALTDGSGDGHIGKVKLMTVHAAKGLEFPNVFLCSLNEGAFPTKKTSTLEAMEEERRLAFVAMTRAEDRLFLSTAKGRDFDGAPRYPSRFILDIDRDLLDLTKEPDESLIKDTKRYIELSKMLMSAPQTVEFMLEPGTRVRHSIFGEGEILDYEETENSYLIRFDELPTPRRLNARAKLEVL